MAMARDYNRPAIERAGYGFIWRKPGSNEDGILTNPGMAYGEAEVYLEEEYWVNSRQYREHGRRPEIVYCWTENGKWKF